MKRLNGILLVLAVMAGCTSLGPKDEFLALSCDDRTALLYDYAIENRRWAIGGVAAGVVGIATGGVALVGVTATANGLKAVGAGMQAP